MEHLQVRVTIYTSSISSFHFWFKIRLKWLIRTRGFSLMQYYIRKNQAKARNWLQNNWSEFVKHIHNNNELQVKLHVILLTMDLQQQKLCSCLHWNWYRMTICIFFRELTISCVKIIFAFLEIFRPQSISLDLLSCFFRFCTWNS